MGLGGFAESGRQDVESKSEPPRATIVGAGPAGLIAAETLARAGCRVTIHERMASPARKFLIAGRGGLNLTHSEPRERFLARYGAAAEWLAPMMDAFPPGRLRAFAEGLGEETFVGSSGRVFPKSFKASPLLRAWLHRLDRLGVRLMTRHRWLGWDGDTALRFESPADATGGGRNVTFYATSDVTLLALGGASWPRLGSDGQWVDTFRSAGIAVEPLRPANSGVRIGWSETFRTRFAGAPLKRIALTVEGASVRGEAMIDAAGLEGGAVYALSSRLREAIARDGSVRLEIDLRPDLSLEALAGRLATGRKGESLSNRLRKAGLPPVVSALLREAARELPADPRALAALAKALPLTAAAMAPIERAISSAGGVDHTVLDKHLMLQAKPGVFLAGEMLDWEAPTGGYLLQACFSTGFAAACGMLAHLGLPQPETWAGPWSAADEGRKARDDD